jgi:hypothetical protein
VISSFISLVVEQGAIVSALVILALHIILRFLLIWLMEILKELNTR